MEGLTGFGRLTAMAAEGRLETTSTSWFVRTIGTNTRVTVRAKDPLEALNLAGVPQDEVDELERLPAGGYVALFRGTRIEVLPRREGAS